MIDDNRYQDIIASIAAVAAFKVNGVASLSGVAGMKGKVQRKQPKSVIVNISEDDTVVIDVYVNAFSGVTIPDLAYDLQKKIAEEVENATKYKVKAVNVNVAGVVFNQ